MLRHALRLRSRALFSTLPAPGPVATPPSSSLSAPSPLAGVSASYLEEHAARVAQAAGMPTIFSNPGAAGHVSRLSEAEILALPPPRRPLYPISELALTLKYLRSVSLSLVLAGLALYLHAKAVLSGEGGGAAREELEAQAPLLARALVGAGLASDLAPLAPGGAQALDVPALAARVHARYSSPGSSTLPAGRAQRLLEALGAAAGGSARAAAAPPAAPSSPPLPLAAFTHAFVAAAAGLPADRLYLACATRLGVVAAPPATLAALGELYDTIVEGRPGGRAFTSTALATLAKEAGWGVSVEGARAALRDGAAGQGRAAAAGSSSRGKEGEEGEEEPATVLSRQEFVEFMALAASCGGAKLLQEEAVLDDIRVFTLLHLGGLRASAGVAPT